MRPAHRAESSAILVVLNDMFIWYILNGNWVATRWQKFSTHIHTNNIENDTKQTIHRKTQKLGRVRAVPHLCGYYPGICLTTASSVGSEVRLRWMQHAISELMRHVQQWLSLIWWLQGGPVCRNWTCSANLLTLEGAVPELTNVCTIRLSEST